MDEITLFAELKPVPPDDLTGMRARTRARLGPAPGAPGEWTFEGADLTTGTGSAPGGLRRLRSARQPGSRMGKPRRRRLAVGLSVVAVAVCAATVVPSVLLGGSGAPAYAVTRNPDGSVRVTIWDIADAKDGADLQEALRAEGIRALVWAGSADQVPRTNPLCQAPASNLEPPMVQRAVVSDYPTDVPPGINLVGTGIPNKGPGWVGFIIRPSAMPSGSVLYFSRLFMPVMMIARNGHGHIIARDSGQAIPPPEVLKHASLPC